MKKIILVIMLLNCVVVFAQLPITKTELDKSLIPINSKIIRLESENSLQKTKAAILSSQLAASNSDILELKGRITSNDSLILLQSSKISELTNSIINNKGRIAEVSESLSKKTLWGIIGVLLAVLLSGILYWLLRKRQQTDKTDFINQLSKTKSSIEESLVKEFGKQTELMDSHLHLIEKQKANLQSTPNAEPDHSLALKVASEINLIERNINLMDSKTKGLKQLQASVGKLKDNLSANGYEMPELLGKQFHQGLKVIVTTSIPDENLENGQEIISKILIPAVLYNDKMIQTAQIEVSVGY